MSEEGKTKEPPKVGARIETKGSGEHEVWNNDVHLATCPTREHAVLVLECLSPRLDSRAEWCFADALTRARDALAKVVRRQDPYDGRALALTNTKLDEAELWFTKVVMK